MSAWGEYKNNNITRLWHSRRLFYCLLKKGGLSRWPSSLYCMGFVSSLGFYCTFHTRPVSCVLLAVLLFCGALCVYATERILINWWELIWQWSHRAGAMRFYVSETHEFYRKCRCDGHYEECTRVCATVDDIGFFPCLHNGNWYCLVCWVRVVRL